MLERARADGTNWALRRTAAIYARVVGVNPVPHGSGVRVLLVAAVVDEVDELERARDLYRRA